MKQIYFLILITCIGNLAYPQDTDIVRFRACSQCSNTWLDNAPNQDFTYDAAAEYPANLIADDYGPRQNGTDIYDWHGGIDYNSAAGNADMGDLILALESGRIGGSLGTGYKRLIVNGTHDLGYGHFFTSDSNPNSGWPYLPLQSGGCRLINMSSPNGSQRCIIRVVAGDTTAIGPVGGNVIFNGKIFVVRDSITAGEPIGPTGFSGLSNGAHLHLFSNPDGSTSIHDTITKDPLQYVQYAAPNYDIQIRKVLNYSSNNTQTWAAPSYPGTNASPIVVRPVMLNEGANLNRYNTVNDINHVELMLRRLPDDDFQLIHGARHRSDILIGARIGENMMPSYLYQDGSGSNGGGPPQIGSLSRQGIRPFAYATNGAHPYDDFYFPDFITRIHTDDPMDGGAAQIANCPRKARYNDGHYEIKAVATDVRGNTHESEVVEFTLDNFQPYITSFTFNANGLTQYTRHWSCGDCGIKLTVNPTLQASQSDWNAWLQNPVLILSVTASEPLENLTLDLVMEGNVLQEEIQGIDLPNGMNWHFDISQYAAELSGRVEFRFSGYDTNGNSLLAFSPSHQNACVTVPTRSGANSWNNPDNIPSGQDNVHAVCIDCGRRSPDGDCAVIALVPDEECLEVEAEITNASGDNASDGSIGLSVSGGAPPYQFAWSNGSSTQDITGLSPGLYVVTISDALCCTAIRSYNITGCQRVASVYVHGEVTEASGAGSNGAIDISLVNINTGVPIPSTSFSYSWTGPNGFTSSNEDIGGLPAGNYCVEVRENQFGCLVASRCFSVCGSLILGIRHNGFINCEGERGTFEVLLQEQNAAAPYEMQWSNGATTAKNEGLVPGIYCVTVTDANGCTENTCLEMKVNFPIELSGQVENTACNDSGGAIVLSASSPQSEITGFQWSNGSSSQNLEGLGAGEYCVTVTNSKGCEKTTCFTVENIELGIGLENIVNPYLCSEPPCVEQASCTENGAIDISVQSSLSETSYYWSGPNGFTANSEDIAGLIPGTYQVTVTAGGCSVSKSFILRPCYEEEYIENNPHDPPGCETQSNTYNLLAPDGKVSPVENGCDGSVVLPYSGGGLYFSWSGPNNFVSSEQNIFNLCEGNYCVTVSNGCGLEKEKCFEIVDCNTQNLSVSGHASNSCPGYEAGAITINPSGGATPYEFAWSNGATTQNLEGVSSGNYCVTVTDVHGCKESNCFTVGSEETVTQWGGCTEVIVCSGNVVESTEYPELEIPHPYDCRKVRVICSGNGAFLYDYTPVPSFEIAGDCVVNEINPVTGFICDTHYGYSVQEVVSGCLQYSEEDCPVEVYCALITKCVFPSLNNAYLVQSAENWLQVGVVGVPPYCFRQFYCRFDSEPLCQCPAPCGSLNPDDPLDLVFRGEVAESPVLERQSALHGQDLKAATFLENYYEGMAQMLHFQSGQELDLLIPNPYFVVVDSAIIAANSPGRITPTLSVDAPHFRAFPNPAADVLFLEGEVPEGGEMNIELYNSLGNVVFQELRQITQGVNNWTIGNLDKLPQGVYWLAIQREKEVLFRQKIILRR